MSLYGGHQAKRGWSVTIGIVAAILLHGGIGAVVWYGRAEAQAEKRPQFMDGQVVDVQAVKFGKKRDLSFLPHKEAVTHDRGPKPKLALSDNDKALPHMKDPNEKAPEEDDPLKRTHRFDTTDQPEQKGVEEEGDPNGVKGGNALVGKGPIYLQHLQAAVQNAWVVPTTITDDQLQKLEAQACVKISRETSKIGEIGMHKTSRDDRFDATLLEALEKVKESFTEPLTDDVKRLLSDDGTICMRFTFQKAR